MIYAVAIFFLSVVAMFKAADTEARWYFFALAVYQLPVWAAWYYMGVKEYFYIYSAMTAFLLIAELAVAFKALEHSQTRVLTLLIAIGIPAALSWAALKHVSRAEDYETIIECSLLAAYAIVVGQSASEMRQPWLYGFVALSWLAQSAFGFGYMLNVGSRAWYEANEYIPAEINIAMLALVLIVGVKHREYARSAP